MLSELLKAVLVKAVSLLMSLWLLAGVGTGESKYLDLLYVVGLINMAKIFDGGIPYLQRISFPSGDLLCKQSEIKISLIVYLILLAIFFLITDDFLISIAVTVAGKLYAVGSFQFNVVQKSHLIYLQHAIGLAACLLAAYSGVESLQWVFVIVSIVTIGVLLKLSSVSSAGLRPVSIRDLWTSNASSNLAANLIFFFYAEFYAVFLYGFLNSEDYAKLNFFMRWVLLLVGVAQVISTILWNQNNSRLGSLDKLSVSLTAYLFGSGVIFFGAQLLPSQLFSMIPVDSARNEVALVALIAVYSVGNLFVSQILARTHASHFLILLGLFEVLGLVACFWSLSSFVGYLTAITLITGVKLVIGTRMIKSNPTITSAMTWQ